MLKKQQIAKTIRQSEEQRREEQRRKQQLRKDYLTLLKDVEAESNSSSRQNFIPNVFIGIFFVGFPLCEASIDWLLVTIVATLNIVPLIVLYSPSSWMSLIEIALVNLVVLQYSEYLYDIPKVILTANPFKCALYLGFNVIIGTALYLFYVKNESTKKPRKGAKKHRAHLTEDPLDEDLEAFKSQMELQSRADISLCIMFILNFGMLILCGIIPLQVLLRSFSLFKRFLL